MDVPIYVTIYVIIYFSSPNPCALLQQWRKKPAHTLDETKRMRWSWLSR